MIKTPETNEHLLTGHNFLRLIAGLAIVALATGVANYAGKMVDVFGDYNVPIEQGLTAAALGLSVIAVCSMIYHKQI